MPRKAQKVLYSVAEILNAWSCADVFIIALASTLLGIENFTEFVVNDKFGKYQPLVKKYFSKILEGNDTLFKVKPSFKFGFWLFLVGEILFLITSFTILKVSRNVLNERLPENVKEYLKIKNDEINRVSNINDFSSRTTLDNNNNNSNKNLLAEE